MSNPRCPKCGKTMQAKWRLVESREGFYGRSKFWLCPNNKNPVHGKVKFRIGGQVIMK